MTIYASDQRFIDQLAGDQTMDTNQPANALAETNRWERDGNHLRRVALPILRLLADYFDPGSARADESAKAITELHYLMHTLRQCRETAQETHETQPGTARGAERNAKSAYLEIWKIAQKASADLATIHRDNQYMIDATAAANEDPRERRERAQRTYLIAERSADDVARNATRAEQYRAWIEVQPQEPKENLRRLINQLDNETKSAIASTANASTFAKECAILAANHPLDPDVAAAGIMATGAAMEAQKRLTRCLYAQRSAHVWIRDHAQESTSIPGEDGAGEA